MIFHGTKGETELTASLAAPLVDRLFILLRFTLIIATSCLLLVEVHPTSIPPLLLLVMALVLVSNIAFLAMPPERLRSPIVVGAAILGDTAWITGALIATGRFNVDFFYLYFFVLFLSGVGENIRLIVLSVIVVCLAYVVWIARTAGVDQVLTSRALIRIPFLFSVAISYGYLMNRLRMVRHRVEEESKIIDGLERSRVVLAEANASLRAEVEERKRVERELRKFFRAAEQSSNLVMIIDDDEKIEFTNSLIEKISTSSIEQIRGRGLEVFKEIGAPAEIVDHLVSTVRNRAEWQGEVPLHQERGPDVWLSMSTSPIRDTRGEFINTILIATDISDRIMAEKRSSDAIAELHRLSQMKSNFVSTVSHELKSPLTAIKNAASLIEPGGENGTNEKFLNIIKGSADRLNFIISDLLDMSKVESGKLTITAEAVTLQSFLSEITEPFEPQAASASVFFDLIVPDTLPQVLADAKRVEQVVTNLLSNALKATRKNGRISVSAELTGDRVTIGVRDTGIGLSVDDQKSVFDAFFQADNVLRNKSGGTGLGLTICRDLVRGHGSDLHLESELGVGSLFSFDLPVLSTRAAEVIAFENDVRTRFKTHPYFTILVIDFDTDHQGATHDLNAVILQTLHDVLHHLVPRSLDFFCDQPAHDRVILVMLSTAREGGRVVKRRLVSTLATNLFEVGGRGMASLKVYGPAAYPEDSDYGAGLIDCAISIGETTEAMS